jgi:hypothetical protein
MNKEIEQEDFSQYKLPDSLCGCDKDGHRQRSIYNQPNHLKHWKKSTPIVPDRQNPTHKKHITRDGK